VWVLPLGACGGAGHCSLRAVHIGGYWFFFLSSSAYTLLYMSAKVRQIPQSSKLWYKNPIFNDNDDDNDNENLFKNTKFFAYAQQLVTKKNSWYTADKKHRSLRLCFVNFVLLLRLCNIFLRILCSSFFLETLREQANKFERCSVH
jgi:hypothetical protein